MRTRLPLFRALVCGVVSLAAISLGCSGTGEKEEDAGPMVNCATVTVPKYSQVTTWTTCSICHSSDRTGAQRMEAPLSVNFDSYAAAKANAAEAVRQVFLGLMPPDGLKATDEQKQSLYNWALCGTPE